MQKRVAFPLLFLVALVSTAQLGAQSAPVSLVKVSRLLDPRIGNVLSPAAVLMEGHKIKQVGRPAKVQAPSGVKIVDLGNARPLPGLIDSHTHLLLDVVMPADAGMPPLEILGAVTTNAAEIGWQDRIGALETGKFAAIIAVSGICLLT